MRLTPATIAILSFCIALPHAGAGKDDAAKKELEAIKGTWIVVLAERDGKDVTDKEVRLTFDAAGKAVVKKGDKLLFEGTIKIDPTKKPKTLDATQTSEGDNKGKTIPGIYVLEGDTLKVCSTAPGKDRPTEFSSKAGSGHFLREYKREKKSAK